jgi:hypothetical protein
MKSSSPKTRFPNLLKGFAKEYWLILTGINYLVLISLMTVSPFMIQ